MQKVYNDNWQHGSELFFNDFVSVEEIAEHLNIMLVTDDDFKSLFNEPTSCEAIATDGGNIEVWGDEDCEFISVIKIKPII